MGLHIIISKSYPVFFYHCPGYGDKCGLSLRDYISLYLSLTLFLYHFAGYGDKCGLSLRDYI